MIEMRTLEQGLLCCPGIFWLAKPDLQGGLLQGATVGNAQPPGCVRCLLIQCIQIGSGFFRALAAGEKINTRYRCRYGAAQNLQGCGGYLIRCGLAVSYR